MMPSLVEELQRDAMDENVSVGNLLRKALVVATKLKLAEFRAWVEKELNGYTKGPVPEYRQIGGRAVMNCGPYGNKPIVIRDQDLAVKVTEHHEFSSVTFIEELVRKGEESGWAYIDFRGPIRDYLMGDDAFAFAGVPQLHIPVDLPPRMEPVVMLVLRPSQPWKSSRA